MRQDEINFDDADLKESLKRAIPSVHAPRSLHQRISLACAQSQPPTDPIPLTRGWLRSGRRMAIAASIAGLGLGIGLFVTLSRLEEPTVYVSQPPVFGQNTFVQNALVRHEQLQQTAADPRVRQSLFSYPQMKESTSSTVPLHIPDPDLSAQGWDFVGGQPFQTTNFSGVQLFYMRASQALSVFVLPPGTYTAEITAACGQPQRHLVASATGRSTLFVIARCPNGKLSQADVQQIADAMARR